jgi:hypothetical protein
MCCKKLTQLHVVADLSNLLQINRFRLYYHKINIKQFQLLISYQTVLIKKRVKLWEIFSASNLFPQFTVAKIELNIQESSFKGEQ